MKESQLLYSSGIMMNGFMFVGGCITDFKLLQIATGITMLMNFYFIYKSIDY